MRRFGSKQPSRPSQEAAFTVWLSSAREDMVMVATVGPLVTRYGLDRRLIEAKLLARQDVLRRQAEARS